MTTPKLEFDNEERQPLLLEIQENKGVDKRGLLTVFGGLCTLIIVGNEYLWGNINTYVISYFHHLGDKNAVEKDLIYVIPTQMLIMCFVNPIGAYYQKRMNTTVLLLIGFGFVFGGVFIATIVAQTWATFFVFYAIVQPIGYGILFWTPILCAWEWFEKQKGIPTGIIVGGFALSPGLFGQITTAMVNPNNQKAVKSSNGGEYFPADVANRVPGMFTRLMLIQGVLAIIALITVKRNPEYAINEQKRLQELEEKQNVEENEIEDDEEEIITVKQGIKSLRFWHISCMMFNSIFFGIYCASVYKSFDLENLSDRVLTNAGSIGMVCNGVGRVVWSGFQDKFGFKPVFTVLTLLQLFTASFMYSCRKSEELYVLCVALAFICEGGNFSMFPVVTANVFGVQNGGQIMTWMFFACPVAALSSMSISSAFPTQSDVDYIFNVSAALTFMNLILLYFLDETKLSLRSQKSRINDSS